MSKRKPLPSPNLSVRLQVIVPADVAATIRHLAALQQRSASAVLRDFIIEVHPVLKRVEGLLELAMTAQGKWPKELVSKLEAMQSGLEVHALGAMGQLDGFGSDMEAARSAAHGRVKNPPRSNRGVKTRDR